MKQRPPVRGDVAAVGKALRFAAGQIAAPLLWSPAHRRCNRGTSGAAGFLKFGPTAQPATSDRMRTAGKGAMLNLKVKLMCGIVARCLSSVLAFTVCSRAVARAGFGAKAWRPAAGDCKTAWTLRRSRWIWKRPEARSSRAATNGAPDLLLGSQGGLEVAARRHRHSGALFPYRRGPVESSIGLEIRGAPCPNRVGRALTDQPLIATSRL